MAKKYTNVPNSLIADDMPFMSGGSAPAGKLEDSHREHFDAWKAADTPTTRQTLLKSVQPVIDTAVYSYAGAKPSPYVKSQAKLMALDSFATYDPAKGPMKSHLLSQLRRLQRVGAQNNQIINIPERVSLDRRHLREAEESLRDELGQDPSDLQIADHTGLSLKRIAHIRKGSPGINTGSILDEQGEVYSPASQIPGSTSNADAWKEMIYYDLSDLDQAIMDYTLGLHNTPRMENTAIAQRLGLSPGAVSQRKAKIQMMLDEQFQVDPFGGA